MDFTSGDFVPKKPLAAREIRAYLLVIAEVCGGPRGRDVNQHDGVVEQKYAVGNFAEELEERQSQELWKDT